MVDKRPKRRKHKDNPYVLNSIKEKNIYTVAFYDDTGRYNEVDIDPKVFNLLNQFELDDLKELNEYDRHIEHLEQSDEELYKKAKNKISDLETNIFKSFVYEDLYNCISKLSEVQKRRIKLYFFEDMTLEEIAKKEHCSKVAVKHSIDDAIKKLQKILKI